jgi:hypothetical protein
LCAETELLLLLFQLATTGSKGMGRLNQAAKLAVGRR